MTYENYLLWATDTTKEVMTKSEFYKWQKEKLINNAEHNKELLTALYYSKPIPDYVTHHIFNNYDNSYKLMYGAELEAGKKYHILLKVLENGYVEGIDVYPDWYFKIDGYNTLYRYYSGVAEHRFDSENTYPCGLSDDNLYLIKERLE